MAHADVHVLITRAELQALLQLPADWRVGRISVSADGRQIVAEAMTPVDPELHERADAPHGKRMGPVRFYPRYSYRPVVGETDATLRGIICESFELWPREEDGDVAELRRERLRFPWLTGR